jgi:iron complex outermembrane recepter protein
MKKQFLTSVAVAALAIPMSAMFAAPALAQSTGTIDAEEGEAIVVTGSRTATGIAGVETPDTPKARTVLSNEYIRTQNPGQSILQTINIVPSVNFTNNDPFGSSGGNIRIRGFDGNRVSLTFDGLPLNDTGNYAIFSNQQLDPEIIESVNVNQGTTDVDSPTAASSGGTINYRSLVPSKDMGAIVVGSYGESTPGNSYNRVLGLFQTGDILGTGIRGYISASSARADKFRGPGDLQKEQYNIRLYKEFGSSGDFISLAGHYNRNRNTSFRALTLAQAALDFQQDGRLNFDNNAQCARPTFATGTAQTEANTAQPSTAVPTNLETRTGLDTSCTNFYGVRINPSNTGNVRFNSKFSLAENVVFTLDAGYQYVLANGGGFATMSETDPRARGFNPSVTTGGVDYSGDTDTLDTVAFYTPNNTNTNRYTVLSSLRWDFAEKQSIRLAYAFDYGRHRQTAEWGNLTPTGTPQYVFGGRVRAPQPADNTGYGLRGRDRFSIAQLNQISAEYRGKFFDNRLEVMLGIRAPFFRRELNQFCYTQATTGTQICSGRTLGTTALTVPAGGNALNFLYVIPGTATPAGQPANAVYAPYQATYKYEKLLPNVGLTFRPVDNISLYASYAKGLSAPRTDNLYRAPNVPVQPETTDNFDAGIRYTSATVRASFGGFYNRFQNRIVTSFDPDTGISVDRNVGKVEIKGLEASLNLRPFKWLSFNAFASYIDAKYKDNVIVGRATVGGVLTDIVAPLAGKKLVETPEWQFGYSARAYLGPVEIGATFKKVTKRFATDLNDVVVPGYSIFDLSGRLNLEKFGLKKTFFQVNVNNVFNRQYLGSINSQSSLPTNAAGLITNVPLTQNIGGSNPTFQIGAPRSFVMSVQFGF